MRYAGRDPSSVEIITGCPDILPRSGKEPLAGVAARADIGVHRVVLPLVVFTADLENIPNLSAPSVPFVGLQAKRKSSFPKTEPK